MSHAYHQGPEDAVLYDDCAECDARAADPLSGLLHLDATTFARLRDRMTAVEYEETDGYRSGNEAKLGRALYYIGLLLERHGRVTA